MSKKKLLMFVLMITMLKGFTQQHLLTVFFQHTVGNQPLVLGETYKNPFGENMIINRFRYYVSNIVLIDNANKKHVLPNEYYLIDEADSASKIVTIKSPVATIKRIEFLLGVDSIRNVSGVQTGTLDPMKGMFWTWNTGYIFAKLEGTSDSSHAAAHAFSYHIGGYKPGENAARKIVLNLPSANEHPSNIIISANINQWFQSTTNVHIAQTPVCHSTGTLALQIADNYSTMFTIAPIQ